jgi:sugar/nucleoside kinase (ribokinase family)
MVEVDRFGLDPTAPGRYGVLVPADVDLLVLGDANPDLILTGDVRPRFGQVESLVDDAALVLGGSGAITACGGAKLGLRVGFVAVVGEDVFGRFTLDALTSAGVDLRGCRIDPHRPTGVSIVLSDGEDRATLTSAGTTGQLRAGMVDRGLLTAARHVHVSSYFLQRGLAPDLAELFDQAHRAGATTSIDPNFDPSEGWDDGLRALLPATDYLFPNAAEARAIAGTTDLDAAARLLARQETLIVMKLGRTGGLAVSADDAAVRVPAVPRDIVDSTGAGDSFDAGFLAGRLRGWSVRRSLELAVTCGSLSTRAVGGTSAQPTIAESCAAMQDR